MTSLLPSLTAVTLVAFGAISLTQIAWTKSDDLQEASRLYKSGNKADAQSRLNVFLSQNPKDVRARFLLGVIHTEQKRNAEAVKIFTDLTEDHPELPEPYNNLAVLHATQGDYEKARKALELAIRTHPSYAIAHENLGDIYATLASHAYDKALQLDNGNAAARSKLVLIKELVPTPAVAAIKPEVDSTTPPAPVLPQPISLIKEVAKPEPVKPEKPTPHANVSQEVLKSLHTWAKAWSSNDAAGYLSFYAPEFRTPNGEPRAKWEASRRERLAKPKKIEVAIHGPRVKVQDDTHATVAFRQQYQSDSLKASGEKTVEMIKRGDRWMIQREVIGK